MKSAIRYVLLGVAFYVLFLIIQFPAKTAYYFLEDALAQQKIPVKLYGIKGTLWKGSASRLVYNKLPFNQLDWEFHPWALLTGKASVTVKYRNENSFALGTVSRSVLGGTTLENAQAKMSATELLAIAKVPAFKLGGEFNLNLPLLELSEQKVQQVHGRVVWSNAESVFPQKLRLGDLFANLTTADDGVIAAKLGDAGGPLEMDGSLSVAPDGKYDFKALFADRKGRHTTLGRALGFMGRYNPQNKVEFKKNGNISEFGFLVK